MGWLTRVRAVVVALTVLLAGGALAGCGATTSTPPAGAAPTTSPAPGSKVDPNSHNFITGPINAARQAAAGASQYLNQEQTPSTTP